MSFFNFMWNLVHTLINDYIKFVSAMFAHSDIQYHVEYVDD